MTKSKTLVQKLEDMAHIRETANESSPMLYLEDAIAIVRAHESSAEDVKTSMQRWIDYHNERADKAESLVELMAETLERIDIATKTADGWEDGETFYVDAIRSIKEILTTYNGELNTLQPYPPSNKK